MAVDERSACGGVLLRSTISFVGMTLILALLLFLPAGFGWRRGWLFFLTFLVFTALSAVFLWRANPDIYVARSRIHPGTKSWDKVLMVPILGSLFAIFPTAGFDAGHGWSSVPPWLVIAGYLLFTLGFGLSNWVYAVNRFAEPSVRIQSDRGHQVVDTGPYAIVRHPLYVASFILLASMPLAMGSYWALVPVVIGVLVLIVRTVFEDRMLQNELDGYRDYASQVRYRLIPGIW
jgi:protein-S-isoprenylcysteine O-methyltransferase Ste14